ncbi:DNA-binding transcriptional regulator Fis [Buchnera aphidicola (Rhopalosiphum padi)]|jgi:Fis family transcriptional regulator|uniref:DNA-binding protein Fis n=1 Tax=Buchnera aphidicola subsp. Rhopalosiphum padi TaxID=98793 RepID=A0A4D6Y9L2_BUCRP|nr:DNA-binding transcriptional regulator Fis [Buchnera aphidicola]QCI25033.1 DNA-binding transcriptional regulator Fis [Buchnera aphidicola (Rhopalosiphum padi)]
MSEESMNTEFLVINTKDKKDKVVKKPLRILIKKSLENYFLHLDNSKCVSNLYQLVLSELERPLLDIIMQHTRGNQTRAALIMGINRSTLRKKLKRYGMN